MRRIWLRFRMPLEMYRVSSGQPVFPPRVARSSNDRTPLGRGSKHLGSLKYGMLNLQARLLHPPNSSHLPLVQRRQRTAIVAGCNNVSLQCLIHCSVIRSLRVTAKLVLPVTCQSRILGKRVNSTDVQCTQRALRRDSVALSLPLSTIVASGCREHCTGLVRAMKA